MSLKSFSGGAQASQDEVYAFATTVANFVDSTSWFEVAFPFGKTDIHFRAAFIDFSHVRCYERPSGCQHRELSPVQRRHAHFSCLRLLWLRKFSSDHTEYIARGIQACCPISFAIFPMIPSYVISHSWIHFILLIIYLTVALIWSQA
jgi:hypothetical protein